MAQRTHFWTMAWAFQLVVEFVSLLLSRQKLNPSPSVNDACERERYHVFCSSNSKPRIVGIVSNQSGVRNFKVVCTRREA